MWWKQKRMTNIKYFEIWKYKKFQTQGVPKMVEWEDPELTSFHRHTKIITIYREATNEKNQNLPEKTFYK